MPPPARGWLARLLAFLSPESHTAGGTDSAADGPLAPLQATFDDLNRRLAKAAARVAEARVQAAGSTTAHHELSAALAAQHAVLIEREQALARAARVARAESTPGQPDPDSEPRARIGANLVELENNPRSGALAARARDQLRRQAEHRHNFYLLLATRLNPTELTYRRYTQAVDGVHRRISEHLDRIADHLRLLAASDIAPAPSVPADPESANDDAGESKGQVRSQHLAGIEQLLDENELALASLAEASARVVSMRELDYQGDGSLANYLDDLERITRAHPEPRD